MKPILLVSGGVADTNELFMRGYQMLQMFEDVNASSTHVTSPAVSGGFHDDSHSGSGSSDKYGSSDKFDKIGSFGKSGSSDKSGRGDHNPYWTVEYDGVGQSGVEDIGGSYAELKVGQLAKIIMRRILESGRVPAEEIQRLQDKEYSRTALHLNFPALVAEGEPFDRVRYYAEPVVIRGVSSVGGGVSGRSVDYGGKAEAGKTGVKTNGSRKFYLCSQWSERPENNDRPYILKWIRERSGDD